MSNLANSYPIFEDNQVLTSSQLNELVTYLDAQSRLTRVKLIGMGVACGLTPQFIPSDPAFQGKPTLKITKGTGVTSEGYLIKMGDCTTTKYRSYTLPQVVNYPPFGVPQAQNLELYELLTDNAPEDPANPSLPLTQSFFSSDNKVVVLFLECYDNDLGSCLTKACDDLGKERTFTLRKLAISQEDLDKIVLKNIPGDHTTFLFPGKYDLPEVTMSRVLFDPNQAHSKAYLRFSTNYVTEMRRVFNTLFRSALPQTYTVFKPILEPLYGNTNPLISTSVETLLQGFMNGNPGASQGPSYLGMQYAYDFMKDLILTYNEFRDASFELMSACCPDMSLFPKHLMLGEALGNNGQVTKYRHYFIEALVTRDQKYLLEKTLTLHKKLVLMTQKFDIDTINNPSAQGPADGGLGEPLLITPSDDKRVPLSDRAIPYYYRIDEPDATQFNLGTLEDNWSYDHARRGRLFKGFTPLSYNNQSQDQSSISDPIRTPLYFDIDRYSFMRIEGHLRQNYQLVKDELERLKKQFNLPFNVVALRLQGATPDEIRSRCSFDDLRTQYLSVREELLSAAKLICDRFTSAQGELPLFLEELIKDCDNGSEYTGSIGDFNNAWRSYASVTATQVPRTELEMRGNPATGVSAEDTTAATSDNAALRLAFPSGPVRISTKKMSNVRDFLVNAITQLCTRLDRLMFTQPVTNITLLPFDLADFKYGASETVSSKSFIKTYVEAVQFAINTKVWLNHLLDQVIRSQKTRNTPELYFVLSQYSSELFTHLDKIITGCFHKKLELIYYTLEYRVQYLKANDQTLFSNFIKKHPGIEHKGGVEPGGTFVIVYNGELIAVDLVQRRNAILRERKNIDIQRRVAFLEELPSLNDTEEAELVQGKKALASFASIAAAIADPEKPTVRIDIDKDHVIGDFALPYLCCDTDECGDVPTPGSADDLNLPAIAMPAYVEYKLGDYAFGKDIEVSTKGPSSPVEVFIDVIGMLQYDNGIDPNRIRLKLVNNFTANHYTDLRLADNRLSAYRKVDSIGTYNTPNVPFVVTATKRGEAFIKVQSGTGKQFISYKSATGIQGVDSFYYMFEILDSLGRVIKRSTVGKITVQVYSQTTTTTTQAAATNTASSTTNQATA